MKAITPHRSSEPVNTLFLEYGLDVSGLETLNCEWWDRIASWTVAQDSSAAVGVKPELTPDQNKPRELVTVTVSFSVPDPSAGSGTSEEPLTNDAEEDFQFSPHWTFAYIHNIARRQFPQP